MLTIFFSQLATVRIHPASDDRINGASKSLNAILKSSWAKFESGYHSAHFCSSKEFIPAVSEQINFETTVAHTIGLVGCAEYFREPGTSNWTDFEISTEKVYVVCANMENSRKVLWLWLTGLVERSLVLRLTLPFRCLC